MIQIPSEVLDSMITHASADYPSECCGALVGTMEAGNGDDSFKIVVEATRLTNVNKQRSADRYEIDPLELLKIEKQAGSRGFVVVGFYHSHPDHPDRPSQFDRDRAWPDYSYVIIAVSGAGEISRKSWTFSEFDDPFTEEELEVVKDI